MLSRIQHIASNLDLVQLKLWLTIVVLVIMTAAIGSQLWSSYQNFSYQPIYTPTEPTVAPSRPTNYDPRSITGTNLFGASSNSIDANSSNLLPATQLNLILRGAFTSSNPKQASAIIQGPNGETRPFKVDSQVYNNARLQAVFSDRIVLSRDGELETLYFPVAGSEASTPAPQTSAKLPTDIVNLVKNNMSSEEIQQTASQLQSKSMTPEQRQALIKKRLQDLRDRARKNKDNNQ